VEPFDPASTLEVSFDYKHLKGASPAFGLWQGGVERYALKDFSLKRTPGWHHYTALVTPDAEATYLDAFLYSFARSDGVTINRYDNLVVHELPVARSSAVTAVDADTETSVSNPSDASSEGHSLIADGSFERTLWDGGNVVGGDESARAQAAPSSDRVTGRRSLELTAVNGGAFTSQDISSLDGEAVYTISFAYKHVEGNPPAFGMWDRTLGEYAAKDFALSTAPGWHRFDTSIFPGPNAPALSLFLYSFAGDGGRSVNRYDDVRVTAKSIPQRLLVVEGESPPSDPVTEVEIASNGEYQGVVRGITSEAWLVLPQAFDDRWHLQIQSTDGSTVQVLTHARVDEFANGWLIQGSGDMSFSIEYEGSSDVTHGLALTLFGACLIAAVSWLRLQRWVPTHARNHTIYRAEMQTGVADHKLDDSRS
jgi:hypothetical protein